MVDNYFALFIIILICLFFIFPFSILLNIITLGIIGFILSIVLSVYKRRRNREVTLEEVGRDLISDPLVVGRAYFYEPETGPIGDFSGVSTWPDDDRLNSLTHEIS